MALNQGYGQGVGGGAYSAIPTSNLYNFASGVRQFPQAMGGNTGHARNPGAHYGTAPTSNLYNFAQGNQTNADTAQKIAAMMAGAGGTGGAGGSGMGGLLSLFGGQNAGPSYGGSHGVGGAGDAGVAGAGAGGGFDWGALISKLAKAYGGGAGGVSAEAQGGPMGGPVGFSPGAGQQLAVNSPVTAQAVPTRNMGTGSPRARMGGGGLLGSRGGPVPMPRWRVPGRR